MTLTPLPSLCVFQVNLKEQGQLIRQDEFLVTFRKKKCFRHLFLFQELILFSKTKKTDVGNDTYIYKQSFKVYILLSQMQKNVCKLQKKKVLLPLPLHKSYYKVTSFLMTQYKRKQLI